LKSLLLFSSGTPPHPLSATLYCRPLGEAGGQGVVQDRSPQFGGEGRLVFIKCKYMRSGRLCVPWNSCSWTCVMDHHRTTQFHFIPLTFDVLSTSAYNTSATYNLLPDGAAVSPWASGLGCTAGLDSL
jgi:hypothetical protein